MSNRASQSLEIRGRQFAWGRRSYVMAIINATPDSFSGDGIYEAGQSSNVLQSATAQALAAEAEGADILDIGGESTRPGAVPVDSDEEIQRVVPLIRAIRASSDLPISIDTYKASVAEAALEAGADIVNDVWGLRADPDLAAVVSARQVPVILMHNRSTPKNAALAGQLGSHYVGVEYDDLLADMQSELMGSVSLARVAGIEDSKIVLDPGLGFGKTAGQNLELLDRCNEIKDLGFPMLIGSSRKSFIGLTLDLPPEERLEGTAATTAIAVDRGADILRVHDVREMVRVARMSDAIVRRSP